MTLSSEELARIQEAEESGEPMSSCPGCGLTMPRTREFWFFSGKQRSDLCKECTRGKSAENIALDRKGKSLLRKVISGQLMDTGNTEHLYDECIQQFGGLRTFVAQMKLLYDSAKNESTKVSVLRMIVRLAGEADKARRGELMHTLIEDQDLMQAAAAIEAMASRKRSEDDDEDDDDGSSS